MQFTGYWDTHAVSVTQIEGNWFFVTARRLTPSEITKAALSLYPSKIRRIVRREIRKEK